MYIGGMSNNYTIPVSNVGRVTPVNTDNTTDSSRRVEKTECQTCKARKYQDGSNESDVSFKTAGHIDPEQSYAKVSAHEREHVANAIQKGSQPNAKLISANVTLKMAVCPECGRAMKADRMNPFKHGWYCNNRICAMFGGLPIEHQRGTRNT